MDRKHKRRRISKRTHNKGIPLSGVYLDGVHEKRSDIFSVRFDDGHGMSINREYEVRVARDGDKTEAISSVRG